MWKTEESIQLADGRNHASVKRTRHGTGRYQLFSPANLAKLIGLTEAGTINSSVAKEVFEQVFEEDVDPESYVEEYGLKIVNDEGALEEVLKEVVAKNPKAIADYKGGKEKALGALVGQTMKAMKGKANPGMVNQKLREMLK